MSLTPNYSFIIPTGSDAVNLLTQCYPNFTSLDSILKPIQESGVTVATDTKVGTVHQLVRTDSSCNMFRFIATGNYASGDTFTVDGSPVTATAMDGTSLPDGAFVINQSVVCVLNNLVLTVLIAGKATTSLPASNITYDNSVSGLSATNAQDAIDEVYNAIPVIPAEHGVYEKWVNTAPGSAFASQSISFSSVQMDALIFVMELAPDEGTGAEWIELDASYANTVLRKAVIAPQGGGYPIASQYNRSVTVVYSSGVYTITFTDCTKRNQRANETTYSETTDNSAWIPVRILGLVHNN